MVVISTIPAVILGLRLSLLVLFTMVFIASFVDWGFKAYFNKASLREQRDDFWWRVTWVCLSGGMITLLLDTVAVLNNTPFFAGIKQLVTLLGLVLLNIAAILTRTGLAVSSGSTRSIGWLIFVVPVGFVLLSLWGL